MNSQLDLGIEEISVSMTSSANVSRTFYMASKLVSEACGEEVAHRSQRSVIRTVGVHRKMGMFGVTTLGSGTDGHLRDTVHS